MGEVRVEHILVTPLDRIEVTGGDVLHAIKRSDPGYVDFGEAYFSIVEGDTFKGWKRHLRMTLNLVVPFGGVVCFFHDDQGGIREEEIGEARYVRLTIPPLIWFGIKGLIKPYSIVMNVADIPHDPLEIERRETVYEIGDGWESK